MQIIFNFVGDTNKDILIFIGWGMCNAVQKERMNTLSMLIEFSEYYHELMQEVVEYAICAACRNNKLGFLHKIPGFVVLKLKKTIGVISSSLRSYDL